MNPTLQEAAALLARELPAPPGALNTLAVARGRKGTIRVLIDPQQLRFIGFIPPRYRGFSVIIEPRFATVALSSSSLSTRGELVTMSGW